MPGISPNLLILLYEELEPVSEPVGEDVPFLSVLEDGELQTESSSFDFDPSISDI